MLLAGITGTDQCDPGVQCSRDERSNRLQSAVHTPVFYSLAEHVEVAERQVRCVMSVLLWQVNHVEVQLDIMKRRADDFPLAGNGVNRKTNWKSRRTEIAGGVYVVKAVCDTSMHDYLHRAYLYNNNSCNCKHQLHACDLLLLSLTVLAHFCYTQGLEPFIVF